MDSKTRWSLAYFNEDRLHATYRQISNISHTNSPNLNVSRLALVWTIHWSQVLIENEDVVGTAPTGDAPTTSEWSTILLPTKVRLILEILRYYNFSIAEVSCVCSDKSWCPLATVHIDSNYPNLRQISTRLYEMETP